MKFETLVQLCSVGSVARGGFAPEIVRSVATRSPDIDALASSYASGSDYFYYRFGNNPTIRHAEALLARLSGMEHAVLFSSGMAAVSAVALAAVSVGVRHAIVQDQVFDQTARLLHLMHRWGLLHVRFAASSEIESGEALASEGPQLVYLESPSNPMLTVTDVRRAASSVRKHPDSLIAVDSTIAPPGAQDLAACGVDMIVHSATKSLGGHNDLMAGVVAVRARWVPPLSEVRRLFGAIPSADDAWLLARSLKTLPLRVSHACRSAEEIARFLTTQPNVARVWYPFADGEPHPSAARRQMRWGGALVSFSLKGGRDAARRFCNALKVVSIATSLGGSATVVEIPRELDWSGDAPEAVPGARVIPDDLIRMSVGLEHVEDLLADISQALASLVRNA